MQQLLEINMKEDTNCTVAKTLPKFTMGKNELPKIGVGSLAGISIDWENQREDITRLSHEKLKLTMPRQPIKWSGLTNLGWKTLVATRVLEERTLLSGEDRFLQDKNAFANMKSRLLTSRRFSGKFVAIHNGRVVGYDRNIVELAKRMYRCFGYSPIYIGKVESQEQVIELPSPEA